jgi:hypothetical protein
LERFVWIAGIDTQGTYPIVAALLVTGVVGTIGFFSVRVMMLRTQIIRGKY